MGKILAAFIVVTALVAGVSMYYLQVYAFYDDVSDQQAEIRMIPIGSDVATPISASDIQAIDADSSPIRFRACFRTPVALDDLKAGFEPYPSAEPLTAPGWFDCFKAEEIGEALERGDAAAFLGTRDITYGIDRIVAVSPDGRGFVWHQINSCGEVVFDGQPTPDGCPTPPESD